MVQCNNHAFIEVHQMSHLIVYAFIYCCITQRNVILWQIVEVVPPTTFSTVMEPFISKIRNKDAKQKLFTQVSYKYRLSGFY